MVEGTERCFRFSDLLSFGDRLNGELEGCHGISVTPNATSAEVIGMLNLSHDDVRTHQRASIKAVLTPDWKEKPPSVYCREDWVRADWDWHSGRDGLLCYVIPEEWRDLVLETERCDGAIAAVQFAVSLCLRNVRWLLYRQFIAHIGGLVRWPKEWPAWPHGDAGRLAYLRSRAQRI